MSRYDRGRCGGFVFPWGKGGAELPVKVFISYRRTDVPDAVGRAYDWLERAFGASSVFMDVHAPGIRPGIEFEDRIQRELETANVFLAMIGPNWNIGRLRDPGDFVRSEVFAALNAPAWLRIIPVLVGADTVMPRRDLLPGGISPLAGRQYFRLGGAFEFRDRMPELIRELKVPLDGASPTRPGGLTPLTESEPERVVGVPRPAVVRSPGEAEPWRALKRRLVEVMGARAGELRLNLHARTWGANILIDVRHGIAWDARVWLTDGEAEGMSGYQLSFLGHKLELDFERVRWYQAVPERVLRIVEGDPRGAEFTADQYARRMVEAIHRAVTS